MENVEFESFLETSDEWIRTRTGIVTRRISDRSKGETTLTLAVAAAKQALEKANIKADTIDMVIVATVTPESVLPCTANLLQAEIGAHKAFGFDLQAACTGFLYGLSVAHQFIRGGSVKRILVLGVETLSTIVDSEDRTTAVLFGDGAGAVVLEAQDVGFHGRGVVDVRLRSDGRYRDLLHIEHGYGRMPPRDPRYDPKKACVQMQGKELFKHAITNMVSLSREILEAHNLTVADVDFFFFHQANNRILEMCLKYLEIPDTKTWSNIQRYGNVSSATIPVCLAEALEAKVVKPGDLVMMTAFGGGLTWGSALVRL